MNGRWKFFFLNKKLMENWYFKKYILLIEMTSQNYDALCLLSFICPSLWTLFFPSLPTLGSCRSTFWLVQIVGYISRSLSNNRGVVPQCMWEYSGKAAEVVPWGAEVIIIVPVRGMWGRAGGMRQQCDWGLRHVWVQAAGAPCTLCPCAEVDACIPRLGCSDEQGAVLSRLTQLSRESLLHLHFSTLS